MKPKFLSVRSTSAEGAHDPARRKRPRSLRRFRAAGLSWPLADDVTEEALAQKLYGAAGSKQGHRRHGEPLESMASEIGVGLAVLAVAKTEQRLKRDAEQRRREEERRRRELVERAKHVADSGGSRPSFRFEVAHHSDLMSPTVPM
jgi:hypothetical protein